MSIRFAHTMQPTRLTRRAVNDPCERPDILVVDDLADHVDAQALLLELVGYRVDVAYDALAAVLSILGRRPKVVLLDIAMPRMDGYEIARRVRSHPSGNEIWLIAVTGYGTQHDREKAFLAGFDHHLLKPANPSDLLDLLAELVRMPRATAMPPHQAI